VPFVTGWMGENHFERLPVAMYGVVLLCAALAYYVLSSALLKQHGPDSLLAAALGRDFKGKISVAIYAVAVPLTYFSAWIAQAMYVIVAIIWLVPDRRVEKTLSQARDDPGSKDETE